MALSVDTTPAIHVTVLRNGDSKYEGKKMIVSRRRHRTLDSLLVDITNQIKPRFGAVRKLYTPKGSRQIREINDLDSGGTYVAGGSERFKRIEYIPTLQPLKNWGNGSLQKPGYLADDPPPLLLPKKNRKYAQRSAQFHKVRQPVQFTVFRNGLAIDKGFKFLLKSREMKSYETILSIISFKIRLVEGAVRKLFTIEGGLVGTPDDITDGGMYVACGHRRFIPGLYGEIAQPNRVQKLPAIPRNHNLHNGQSPRTQSNPLPAIQKKAMIPEKKALSEKDSPAPLIEEKEPEKVQGLEGRESTIPDMVTDDGDESISRTEVKQTKSRKLPAAQTSNVAVVSDEIQTTPSKSNLNGDKPKKTSNPELLTNGKDVVFNAKEETPNENNDGKFLMQNNEVNNADASGEAEDEVEEDGNLVEDKPVDLQNAEEIAEEV